MSAAITDGTEPVPPEEYVTLLETGVWRPRFTLFAAKQIHCIGTTFTAIVALAGASALADGAADLRLPTPVEYPWSAVKIDTPTSQAAREQAFAGYYTAKHAGFDTNDPVCSNLVWLTAKWFPVEGTWLSKFSNTSYDHAVSQFNSCQDCSAALNARPLPQGYKTAWRKRWAREFLNWRLPLDPKLEIARTDVPAGGRMIEPNDGKSAMAGIEGFYDDWKTLAPAQKKARLDVLAYINADLDTDGYYVTTETVNEQAPHVSVPLDDITRVYRYELIGDHAIYLPPQSFLAARAVGIAAPEPEPSAAVPPVDIYDAVLPGLIDESQPLHLHLAVRDGRFLNGWTTTPTLNNWERRIRVTSRPGDKIPQRLEVHTFNEILLKLEFTLNSKVMDLSYTAGLPNDDPTTTDVFERKNVPGTAKGKLRSADPAVDVPDGNWPWLLGPKNCSEAVPADEPLVEDPRQARLAWVSDQPIPCGRGPDLRGRPKRLIDQPQSGGWAGVLLAEKRLYMWYYKPSGTNYYAGTRELMKKEGGHPDEYKLNLLDADDVIHCFDPTTGRTIWKRRYRGTSLNWSGFNKSGPELTPCYHKGRVYTMGTLGYLHCVDAKTGATVWQNDIGQRARLQREFRRWLLECNSVYGSRSDFSTCLSACGGVIAVSDNLMTKGGDGKFRYEHRNGLLGFDADTGQQLWHIREIGGNTGTPWSHEDRHYFVLAGDGISLVEARSGRIVWRIPEATFPQWPPLVADDTLVGLVNGSPTGYRITEEKPVRLWQASKEKVIMRHPPVAYNGHAYLGTEYPPGSRPRRTLCVNMTTGKVVARPPAVVPGLGFFVASNDRMIGAHDHSHASSHLSYYRADPQHFGPLVKSWQLPISGAYTTVWTPAFAGGRMYLRLVDRLACYDFRVSSTALGLDEAKAMVGILMGNNEGAATRAAQALRNVKAEAEAVRDAAFAKCLASDRPHLLKLAVECALWGDGDPGVVVKALKAAAGEKSPVRLCNILAGLSPEHKLTTGILNDVLPAAIARGASWTTNASFIESLARFGPVVGQLVPSWKSAATAALKKKDYNALQTVLGLVPMDGKHVKADEFVPFARQALESLTPQGIATGAGFLKRYGLPRLPPAEQKKLMVTMKKALEAKPFEGKLSVLALLPEFGAGARPLIPLLRKVYLEPGMREDAAAAIKAIDPGAPVVKVQMEPGLGDDSEEDGDLLDL